MIASPGLVPEKIRIKQGKNYHQDNQTPRISIADPHINTCVERDRKTIRAIPLPPPPPQKKGPRIPGGASSKVKYTRPKSGGRALKHF